VPVQLKFNYTVGEASGNRPALVQSYDINFGGITVNTNGFKGCTAATIEADQSDANCPSGSLMGTGNVENITGATSKETDKSLTCHLDLKVYNSRNNHAALYLHGASTNPKGSCPLAIDRGIDAKFVKRSNGSTSLVFSVIEGLLHPIAGFDNAVVQVKSTISKRVATIRGKKHGFFESVGGCKAGKRTVSVTFTQVDGVKAKKSTKATCTS